MVHGHLPEKSCNLRHVSNGRWLNMTLDSKNKTKCGSTVQSRSLHAKLHKLIKFEWRSFKIKKVGQLVKWSQGQSWHLQARE